MIKFNRMEKNKTFYFYRHKENKKDDKYINKISDALINNGFAYDEKGEYGFIFGGDGSLFHNAFETSYSNKYCLINCGHLGHFSDYNVDEFEKIISSNNKFVEEKIPCYKLTLSDQEINFVNDIYITENQPVEIEIKINSISILKQKANGIVLGTSIGSSGYLYSLGSPLVFTSDEVIQFSLLAPIRNKTGNNFISKGIISAKDIVEINLSKECTLFHDGIKFSNRYKKLVISKSSKSMCLLHFKNVNNVDRVLKSFKQEV